MAATALRPVNFNDKNLLHMQQSFALASIRRPVILSA